MSATCKIMTFFPKFGPFYDPSVDREFFEEPDGHLHLKDPSGHSRCHDINSSERERYPGPHTQNREVGWNSFVQDHGDLFYVESESNTPRNRRRQDQQLKRHFSYNLPSQDEATADAALKQGLKNSRFAKSHSNYDHDEVTGESDSAYGSGQNSHPTSREKRTARLHLDINRNKDEPQFNHVTQNHRISASTEVLNSDSRNLSSKQRNSQSRSSGSYSFSPPVLSGKRKSIYMVPNLQNVSYISNVSGIVLCEKLFGIVLCQYKQRPPKPNGSNFDQLLRDRKVIVQAVVNDSQADICGSIHRGDMLVGLNDIDVTWVNLDDLFRALSSQQEVKLTFQVPQVIGPKQPTPPLSPSCSTPPLPPQIPTRSPNYPSLRPPPRPPPPPAPSIPPDYTQVPVYCDETSRTLLRKYMVAVMYLTISGHGDEATDDVIYQYPMETNKITDIRGLYLTISSLLTQITGNSTKMTAVKYRGNDINVSYWKDGKDLLVICLPADRVPDFYLQQIMSDLLYNIKLLYGASLTSGWSLAGIFMKERVKGQATVGPTVKSGQWQAPRINGFSELSQVMSRVFQNRHNHKHLDQLISLTLERILLRSVDSQSVPVTSPLEPALLDTLAGIRWLRLDQQNRILCDEILSEFEAADYSDQEEYESDERRDYGIMGSCLYYKDYLLCSHLFPEDLSDVHMLLKHHSLLNLVNKERVEDIVIWREIFPTRLCHRQREDKPGYREPTGRWFLLVVIMNHYIMCTILEAGSYSRPVVGNPIPDPFYIDQVKVTLSQLDADDADLESACNERLFIEVTGPALKSLGASRQGHKNSLSEESLTSQPKLLSPSKSEAGSRNRLDEDLDRVSLSSPPSELPGMRRQGSKVSYGSNDSNGSSNSANILKGKNASHMGSVMDATSLNRSFSKGDNSAIKITRGVRNCLFHYVLFDICEGVYVSPSRRDMASVQGSVHQHILYNFYSCCLRIHETFRNTQGESVYVSPSRRDMASVQGSAHQHILYNFYSCCLRIHETFRKHRGNQSVTTEEWEGVKEEGVMFTCQVDLDPRKPPSVLMYWVIGRLYPGDKEIYVCIEDGTPQTTLELAFNFNFGLL